MVDAGIILALGQAKQALQGGVNFLVISQDLILK
jgi:hypothetical protein